MPARKKTEEADILDIESLLDEVVVDEKVDPAKEKAALITRIQELEKELAAEKVESKKLSAEEKKVSELEKKLQERQEQQAVTAGSFEELEEGNTLLFHVLQTGFLAFGRVWNRGDEIELVVGSDAYKEAESWLPYVFDTDRQFMEWGKIKYELGPSPFPVTYVVPQGASQLDQEVYKIAAQTLREKNRKV